MTRAVSSNLKVKKSRKIIEDSDRESITSISDSEKSDYEEDECFTSSESEGEETPPPQEMFDDSNVKIDMSVDSIKPQKIKLTSNLLIECRTITVDEPDKRKFSYPGIVFIRKMKDDKCFEFNIPLAIASRVISAIEIMTNERNNFQKK